MWLGFSFGFLLHISWNTFLYQSRYKNVQLLTWRVGWPGSSAIAQLAILAALLVALLFTLCVWWINYGQHTPDKVPIVVVVIDWIQDSARACWPLLTKCSLQARLRSEHAPSHITARSYHPQSVREPGQGTMRKLRWEWGVGTNLQTNISATAVSFSDNISKDQAVCGQNTVVSQW